jgi:DNA-binding PadR family transcriptional regulator
MKQRQLTELEGAILGAIRQLGAATGYRLRRAFLDSPSLEWSGSAGSIYPAIRRLAEANYVCAGAAMDGRGGLRYALTAKGERAIVTWLGDVDRAISPGLDPFRTRAGLWSTLPQPQRGKLMKSLVEAAGARCLELKLQIPQMEVINRRQAELELELHRMRLRWLGKYQSTER